MTAVTYLVERLRSALRSEEGASATEYAVLVAIIVVAVVAIGALFQDALTNIWNQMSAMVSDAINNTEAATP